jgi:hypothetical protein
MRDGKSSPKDSQDKEEVTMLSGPFCTFAAEFSKFLRIYEKADKDLDDLERSEWILKRTFHVFRYYGGYFLSSARFHICKNGMSEIATQLRKSFPVYKDR